MSSNEKPTTAIGAALADAQSKTEVKTVTVVKAKDAPSSQTPSQAKKLIPVDTAMKTAKAAVTKSVAKKPASKPALDETETDPAQFMQVGAPAKPTKPEQWFPETYTLATNDHVRDSVQGKVIEIRLYGEGCTECSSLILPKDEDQAELEKCHFTFGNIYCPAAYTRIRFVGQKMRLMHKMKKAQGSHDVNKLSKLMAELDDLTPDDRKEVLIELGMLPREREAPAPKAETAEPIQDTEDR